MSPLRAWPLALALAFSALGCSSLPSQYGMAYTELHNAKNGDFIRPSGEPEYREFDTIQELADAEPGMYRDGYVMIGYSNMLSPQLDMVTAPSARSLGRNKGAAVVLNTFGDGHFLLTLWARPRTFVFGAYFTDDLPSEASEALGVLDNINSAVMVQSVVTGSAAFDAGLAPGDMIFSFNGEPIADEAAMSALLERNAGGEVVLGVWPMRDGNPQPVVVTLGR